MVHGERAETRRPLGTPLADLEAAREALREQLSKRMAKRKAGTLAQDADEYLAAMRGLPSFKSRRSMVDRWVAVAGEHKRKDLAASDIRAALGVFQRSYSPQYCRHLLRTLQHLYTVLDGKGAANPARDVPMPSVRQPLARAIPLGDLVKVLRKTPRRSKTKARLLVMATTGMAHVELAQLRPQDINFKGGTVLVHGRRKGGGTRPRLLPLTRHSRRALRYFIARKAWGPFSASSMRSRFRDACKAAGFGDTDWRPYDLRHTMATELARLTKDERAVQAWLGHTTPATTQRYTLGSVPERLLAGAALLDGPYRKTASGTATPPPTQKPQ